MTPFDEYPNFVCHQFLHVNNLPYFVDEDFLKLFEYPTKWAPAACRKVSISLLLQ